MTDECTFNYYPRLAEYYYKHEISKQENQLLSQLSLL